MAQTGKGWTAGTSVQSVPGERGPGPVGDRRRPVAAAEPVQPSWLQPAQTVRCGEFGRVPLSIARWQPHAAVRLLQPVPPVSIHGVRFSARNPLPLPTNTDPNFLLSFPRSLPFKVSHRYLPSLTNFAERHRHRCCHRASVRSTPRPPPSRRCWRTFPRPSERPPPCPRSHRRPGWTICHRDRRAYRHRRRPVPRCPRRPPHRPSRRPPCRPSCQFLRPHCRLHRSHRRGRRHHRRPTGAVRRSPR